MQRNFKEAFEGSTTEQSSVPLNRIAQLEQQIKELRAKFKKEEISRRQYQDIARRKDEEIKKVKDSIKLVEGKLREEADKSQK